ncbi:DUF2515 family protein [Paenibacillus sp. MBLB4367]|uniref:DUF2515 family protein n=1 Tax=Paenibacillus sp. MBLB4367 TaxID=3384767 RepID=UPI0039081936
MPTASGSEGIVKLAGRLASSGWRLLQGKLRGYARSAVLLRSAYSLRIKLAVSQKLRGELETRLHKLQSENRNNRRFSKQWNTEFGAISDSPPTADDQAVVEAILEETNRCNRNNITRTEAYWRLYAEHPELHWALLAHMVSRNGGWAMTDLRGELLSRMITPAQSERMFQFMERANALIFGDAFPQLLLYAEGKKRGIGMTRLLPHFHVSAFMSPVWEQFLKDGDPVPLTIGLIVNEQNYIEERVVQNRTFREELLNTAAFHAYAWLQLTQVLFPYAPVTAPVKGAPHSVSTGAGQLQTPPRLAGLVLESFASLEERIGVGKKLYALLYGVPDVLKGVLAFAESTPHTGTRADYWPHLFSDRRSGSAGSRYTARMQGNALRTGAAPLYSPKLTEAWPDQTIAEPQQYDWFCDKSGLAWFTSVRPPFPLDMTNEAFFGLGKLELAVIAAEMMHD